MSDIDTFAQDIRAVDGAHTLGAAALAEALHDLGYRKHPEPEATEARIERVRAEQREVDAQIAESQGIIGRNLEPYWEGRDDASELIAEEIRKSRLTIDEVTAVDRKADR